MRARIPANTSQKKAIDAEIKQRLAEYDKANTMEIDAMVLWVLYSQFGFGKKRLRRFFDAFTVELEELLDRYVLDNTDTAWLCTRKLKDRVGIDIYEWSEEDKKK